MKLCLNEGEMVVIPRGVEHLPVAEEECHIVLLEPKTTLNTGNVESERTVADPGLDLSRTAQNDPLSARPTRVSKTPCASSL